MPNRILRDWTDSTRIELLNAEEERFFVRLMMKADDFGYFHGDPRLLKAALFPLLTDTRLSSVRQWRDKCVQAGLCHLYEDQRGREFLKINNFKQRTRATESKFPTDDGHMTVNCQSHDRQLRTETETETDTETETGNPPSQNGSGEIPTLDEVKTAASMMGILESSAIGFWEWHEINNAWRKNGTLIKWRLKLVKWAWNDKEFKANAKRNGNSQTVDRNQGTANAGKANQYANLGRVVSNQSVR